jgi:hypothetical protein
LNNPTNHSTLPHGLRSQKQFVSIAADRNPNPQAENNLAQKTIAFNSASLEPRHSNSLAFGLRFNDLNH